MTLPFPLQHAVKYVENSYGHIIDIEQKSKSLRKFGRIASLATSSEVVQEHGGTETYLTDNLIDTVVSSDAGDTQSVLIEGHTIDGSGNLSFSTQTVTLNGTTNVTLATPIARANRLKNLGSISLAGTVKVVDAAAPGVVYVQAGGAINQSQKAATSISLRDYWLVDSLYVSVQKRQAAAVDFSFQTKEKGGVFVERWSVSSSSGNNGEDIILPYPIIITPNSDFRVLAVADASSVEAVAAASGYLAVIDRSA